MTLNKRWWILAGIFGFLRTGSLYFHNGEAPLSGSVFYAFLCLFRFAFYSLLFAGMMAAGGKLFSRCASVLFRPASDGCAKHSWLDYGVLFLGWLPNIVIKYPGAMCWDTWNMLFYYRTGHALNGHHSAFYSLMLGWLVSAFERLGHANWGLFLLVLCQYLLYVLAFGSSLGLIRRMGFRREVLWGVTVFYLLCPYVIAYLGVVMKDAPYSALMLLLTVLLTDYSMDPDAFCASGKKLLLLVFAAAGSCLVRKNGLYVMSMTVLFCMFSFLKNKKSLFHFRLPGALLCGCVLCLMINGALKMNGNVLPGSIKEALSLPFQQTARYVKYHDDEVSEQERAVIDSVLRYDTLADRYDPRLADFVKNEYTGNDAMLPAYFSVWARQFFRHPLCCVAATWEQNYYLFVPEAERDNVVLYENDDVGYELGNLVVISERTGYYEPVFYQNPVLDKWKTWVISEYQMLHDSLVVGTLSNVSVNTYLFLAMMTGMLIWNKARFLPFVPAVLSLVFVIVGPVIQGHPRYMFPIIYSMPTLAAFALFTWHDVASRPGERVTV